MKFRTIIEVPESSEKITYQDKIFGLGSCFVTNIQNKLDYYQFQNYINPFGTVFNPVSIRKLLQRVVNQELFNEQDLFFHQNLWKSFDLHSEFNRTDKIDYLQAINDKINRANQFLKTADWLFLTFGTAWVYHHKKTGEIVNNCHKVPQKEFDKIILTPTEIADELKNIIQLARKANLKIKILMSISPVRHLKNGFVENQRSKSHLITAVHTLKDAIHYFPSYEILMDDLRDYRFYKDDYIHPNQLAINYIWKIFSESIISSNATSIMKQIDKIRQSLAHKSFNPGSLQDLNRMSKLQTEITAMQQKYKWMTF